jgi:hypothetical protein
MCNLIKYNLIRTLPIDIIINYIIPYTYSIQPKNFLFDIRSYHDDLSIVENVYFIDYNNYMLLNDLIIFCNSNIGRELCRIGEYTIMQRNFILWSKSQEFIDKYILDELHTNRKNNPNKKVKFLWWLLTPLERTRFINKYVLI